MLVAGRDGARFRVRFPGLAPVWLFADQRADRYDLVVDVETGQLLDIAAYRKRRLIERRQVVRFEI